MGWTTKYIYIYVGREQPMALLIPSQMRSPDPERTEVSCSIYHICVYYIYICVFYMYVCVYYIYIMYVLYMCVMFFFMKTVDLIDMIDVMIYYMGIWLIGWCIMIYIYIYIYMWDQLIIKSNFISEKRPLWYHYVQDQKHYI